MKQHIRCVVSSCFFQLRLYCVKSAGEEVTKRLVTALELSRLEYGNSVLAGRPESTIRPLQRVQNTATRLITDTKPRDYITPVLMHLHWLLIESRIVYELSLPVHLIHTSQRSPYMAEMVEFTAASSWRSSLRSASHHLYRTPALKTKFGERAFSHAGPAAWSQTITSLS